MAKAVTTKFLHDAWTAMKKPEPTEGESDLIASLRKATSSLDSGPEKVVITDELFALCEEKMPKAKPELPTLPSIPK